MRDNPKPSMRNQAREASDRRPEEEAAASSPVAGSDSAPGLASVGELHGVQKALAYARLLVRPSYHLRRIIDDARAAKHALSQWDLDAIRHDEPALARAIRGRMFATFLLSGMFGVFGPILGTVSQYITQNPTEGFFVGLVIANLFGTIGYQIIWAAAHQRMYKARQKAALARLMALERDLLPLQWDGMRYTALFLCITVPIMVVLIEVLRRVAAPVAAIVPFPVLAVVVEMVVIHSSLVRVMGDLFEKHAARVAHSFSAETDR